MEGKLIKTSIDSHHNGHYFLNDSDGFAIGSTDKDWCKRAVSKRPLYILSLKNCETIENGYDLDELAESLYLKSGPDGISDTLSFKIGFQKALELLGDNKELIIKLNDLLDGLNSFKYQVKASYLHFDCEEIIKSLQQNEWDVEIVMECPECKEYGYVYECRNNCNKKFLQPKLDADGYLILKRK